MLRWVIARWQNANDGEKLLIVLGVLGILVAAVFGLAQLKSPSSTTPGPKTVSNVKTSTSVSSSTKAEGSTTPEPPPANKYLMELTPKGGETPERGKAEVGGEAFRHSIFWEQVGTAYNNEGFCDTRSECRAVAYDLEGKYTLFTASVGGQTTNQSNEAFKGHWWVVRDGTVEQGPFDLNRSPVPIKLSVSGVHTLELRIQAEALGDEPTLAWGDAYVSGQPSS